MIIIIYIILISALAIMYIETLVNEIFSEPDFNKHFMKLAEFREKRIDLILSDL
jgi:hypothetical protein